MNQVEFTLDEGIELAYGLVAREAALLGIRILAVKGPVLQRQGIGGRRVSADADVLVDGAAGELAERLTVLGWERRPISTVLRVYPDHSIELFHRSWPCDIDLHLFYPGLFASPAEAFEALSAEKSTVTLAGQPVDAPSPAGHLVVLAAHALRTRSGRGESDLALVLEKLRGDERTREEFDRIASRAKSRYVLRDVLAAVGCDNRSDLSRAEEEAWDRLVAGNGASTAYHVYSTVVSGPAKMRLRAIMSLIRAAVASARTTSRRRPDGSLRAPWWRRMGPLVHDVRVARQEYALHHPQSRRRPRKRDA